MSSPSRAPRVRVLTSYGPPNAESNPYVLLVERAIAERAEVVHFSWREALTGSYDVFHVHWPEVLLRRRTLPGRVLASASTLALVARLRRRRTNVVRTHHNLTTHEPGSRIERILMGLLDRATTNRIVLNEIDGRSVDGAHYIPHGHYKDWYSIDTAIHPRPGELLAFGLLRPYKGLEELMLRTAELREGGSAQARLHVVGRAPDPAYAARLARLADETGTELVEGHASDADLARAICSAELVVLPYTAMHNSGAALLALSCGRPVLVPENDVTRALAGEVGHAWVHTFSGALTSRCIGETLARVRESVGACEPNLAGRDWALVGEAHLCVYEIGEHGHALP